MAAHLAMVDALLDDAEPRAPSSDVKRSAMTPVTPNCPTARRLGLMLRSDARATHDHLCMRDAMITA